MRCWSDKRVAKVVISGIGHAAAVAWVINTATAARHPPAGGGAVTVTYLI